MKNLRRTKVDNFNLGQAVALEEIKGNSSIVGEKIISIEKIFENQERIQLNEYKLNLFLNGVKLTYNKPNGVYRIYNENKFIGLGIYLIDNYYKILNAKEVIQDETRNS